ncbi:metal ion transmembrane transporter [Apiospora arundinis]|uniref:Metal ion transmembrane transporter n=1 Tax=Apiospora arundinis TaxID=335852 RepID=A0ABR2JMU7_9PEZI
MVSENRPASWYDRDHGTFATDQRPGSETQRNSNLASPGVSVTDWFYPSDVDIEDRDVHPECKEVDFMNDRSFSEFLVQTRSDDIVSRLIHIRNVPWALPIIMGFTGRKYGSFPEWMAAPSIASSPREQVWRPFHENGYSEMKFAVDYFTTHPKVLGRNCCPTSYLTDLKFGIYAQQRQVTESRVCLQKIGVICFSGDPSGGQKTDGPASTTAVAVVVHDSGVCPPDWRFPLDVNWRGEARLGPKEFPHRFFEHILYWSIRGVAQRWSGLIRSSQVHYARFEKEIFSNPESEASGEELWRLSSHWNVYNRLFTLHIHMVDYLEARALRFLQGCWEDRTNGKDSMGEVKVFGGVPKSIVAGQTELMQGLVNPTMNMLDMIYKRVAIRDARQSLMLNESLWRLSWITFIFLPLTFITGIFGMNVDTFSDNPSIKWWFIVAVPLMVLVLLGWFAFRHFYVVVNQAAIKRERSGRGILS